MAKQHAFQAPRGTRDFLPIDAARRRWLLEHWRRASTRHGFEEIDGPTFEHLDLYTVKSGEGIVSELFSFKREGGSDTYALRPEFTPTLARMYATKANSLPTPTKWFSVSNFFRAERPQRGRLREFWQWNVDFIGHGVEGEKIGHADLEVLSCCINMLNTLGLSPNDLRVHFNMRNAVATFLQKDSNVDESNIDAAFVLLDRMKKLSPAEFTNRAKQLGFTDSAIQQLLNPDPIHLSNQEQLENARDRGHDLGYLSDLFKSYGLHEWCNLDTSIVRGLAYYTGFVFEVIAEGERAVAGGGRYDNLIEMFGGPPTPAVGFGMGDVVLTNLLLDKGLMPSDAELMEWAGNSPQVFVLCPADEHAEARVRPAVAALRQAGLHARHTYKSTRNIGKLLKEASTLGARMALLIEPGGELAKIKQLVGDGGESEPMLLADAIDRLARELAPTDGPPSRRKK